MKKQLLVACAIVAGMALTSSAALVTGNLTQQNWLLSTSTDTPTMSQTVGAGADYLIVSVTSETSPNENPMTSMTYGGSAMTLLGSVVTSAGFNAISYYYLANPTAGTANLVGDRAGTATSTFYGLSFSAWTISGGATSLEFFSATSYAATTPLTSAITVDEADSMVIASYTGRNNGRLTSSSFFGVTPAAFNNGNFAGNNMPVGASYDAWSFVDTDVDAGSYTVDITTTDVRSAMAGVVVSVPEPATIGLVGFFGGAILLVRRFRNRG